MQAKSIRSILDQIEQLCDRGGFEKALQLLEKNKLKSDVPHKIKFLQLKVFNRTQRLVEASGIIEDLNQYIELDSQSLEVLRHEDALEIALYHVLIGDLFTAEKFYRLAIKKARDNSLYFSELAILYEQQGKKEQAIKIYEKILARVISKKKLDAASSRVLGRLSGLRVFTPGEVKVLESLLKKYEGDALEPRLFFSLARIHSRLKNKDREIELLKKANECNAREFRKTSNTKSVLESKARKESLRQLFDKAKPDWMPGYEASLKPFLFILGMPRSGTTLLEQILGAHSKVGNSGESRGMGIALNHSLRNKPIVKTESGARQPFGRYKLLTKDDSVQMIKYYTAYQHLFTGLPYITDKELSNIDRIGVIANMFPNASFIVIKRNPLDVCASIMQQDFSLAYFANSSLECVQEYLEYYEKVEHWRSLYKDKFFSVDYEDLVSNFEVEARSLFKFIKLDWEDEILRFYERGNSVRTPSLSQVRSRINDSSIDKWKVYRPLIEPAIEYLSKLKVVS